MLAQLPALLAEQAGGAENTVLINWWTLVAQVFNFLVLVLLLRHFLYGRVVRALDQREQKIASNFEAAEQKQQGATAQAEALQREKDQLDRQRESMLAEARQQADEHRQELTHKAREEVEAQAVRWREELQRGKDAFLQDMRDSAGRGVCAIARKALADLADVQLEAAMVAVLIRRLADLPADGREELTDAMAAEGQGLVVATAWELPEADRDTAAAAVREHIAADADVRFETDPKLTCGIELRAGGRAVSWTIESYIEGIRAELSDAIDRAVVAQAQRAGGEAKAAQAQQKSSNE